MTLAITAAAACSIGVALASWVAGSGLYLKNNLTYYPKSNATDMKHKAPAM